MALKDRILQDIDTVFIRSDHFADQHNWNGVNFTCVVDEETALKRKNNNVSDISWQENTDGCVIYVNKNKLPGRAVSNETVFFDGKTMRVMEVSEDMGMLCIRLMVFDPKAVM